MTRTDVQSSRRDQQKHGHTNVLIVEDDPQAARVLLEILARKGIGGQLATTRKAALGLLDKHPYRMAFLGTRMSHTDDSANNLDALGLLREIKATAPEMPVVMIAEHADTQDGSAAVAWPHHATTRAAVAAIQAGCCDFLLKPLDTARVKELIETLLPNRRVTTAAAATDGDRHLYQIIGRSPRLTRTVTLAEKIAPTSVPILISGESGTGKELIAMLIHHKSRRASGPFIRVNCAALSDTLLESELFGHEKGAFTGAYAQRKGRFEAAHGGTLLLDEITETPLRFQAKLLRILEQQEFERVGSNKSIRINVRIISTTNRDLPSEVQAGRFRQDLYYRLSASRLMVSPLRERPEDLPELTWHFINLYARETQRRITDLDPAMIEIFRKYHWPGNIRQLRNVVLTSLTLGMGPTLSLADVSWLFDELQPVSQHGAVLPAPGRTQCDTPQLSGLGGVRLDQLERQAIIETLSQTSGNQTKAAKVLGISDRTLREKMRRYRKERALQTVS